MITAKSRAIVAERSGGICEICQGAPATNIHHRQPRGMGGTRRNIHTPAWLLHLCGSGTTGCHGRIEIQRAMAYRHGWLLRSHQRPSTVPAWIARAGFVILTDDGRYEPWGEQWRGATGTPDMPGAQPAPSSFPPGPLSASSAKPTSTTG